MVLCPVRWAPRFVMPVAVWMSKVLPGVLRADHDAWAVSVSRSARLLTGCTFFDCWGSGLSRQVHGEILLMSVRPPIPTRYENPQMSVTRAKADYYEALAKYGAASPVTRAAKKALRAARAKR